MVQHLDGGQLLFALCQVHADQVIQHHRRQGRSTHDDQHHHRVQAHDEVVEHGGGILCKGGSGHIVAGQQGLTHGVAVGGTVAAGLGVYRVPGDILGAQQGLQLGIGHI